MKKYFLLVVFAVLFNQSFAQDSCSTKCKELKHGIQFQVTNILNLTNFNGYTFSYRYLFNKNSGLRIGLFTSLNNEEEDITQRVDSLTNHPPNKSDSYNFKISVQYLCSIMSYNNFDLIVGGGPFVSFYNVESHYEYLGRSSVGKRTEKNKGTGFGLDLILGVEYKLASNVILSGEYGVSMQRDNSDIEYTMTDEYETYTHTSSEIGERNRTVIKGLGVNLGIAVFF
jgi:opacity protein-like surface antigen